MTYPHPEPVPALRPVQTDLVWERGNSAWYIRTACGAYTVAKWAERTGFKYVAFNYKTTLGFTDTAADAQKLCRDHFLGGSK